MAENVRKYLRPFTSKALDAYEEEEGLKLGEKNLKSVQSDKEQLNIRRSERPQSKMTDSKNADAGTGRGTTTFDKTFKQAFAEARKAGQGTFDWNGKKYTTEMAGEKKPTAAPLRETMESDSGTTNPSEFKRGGKVKKMASGGSVGSASKRADGCCVKGKTRGKIV
jgi:hypothetical protein